MFDFQPDQTGAQKSSSKPALKFDFQPDTATQPAAQKFDFQPDTAAASVPAPTPLKAARRPAPQLGLWDEITTGLQRVSDTLGAVTGDLTGLSGAVEGAKQTAKYIGAESKSIEPGATGVRGAYRDVIGPAGEASAEFLGSMVHPANFALMGALSALPVAAKIAPAAAQRLSTAIRGYFIGSMGIDGVKSAYDALVAESKGNIPEAVRKGVSSLLDLTMAGGMVAGPGKGYTPLSADPAERSKQVFRNLIYKTSGEALPPEYSQEQASKAFRKAQSNLRDPQSPEHDNPLSKDLSAAYSELNKYYRGQETRQPRATQAATAGPTAPTAALTPTPAAASAEPPQPPPAVQSEQLQAPPPARPAAAPPPETAAEPVAAPVSRPPTPPEFADERAATGTKVSLTLADGRTVVGGIIHPDLINRTAQAGIASEDDLLNAIPGFTTPDGRTVDHDGKEIKTDPAKIVRLDQQTEPEPEKKPAPPTMEISVPAAEPRPEPKPIDRKRAAVAVAKQKQAAKSKQESPAVVGSAAASASDTALFQQAKQELGEEASISEVAKRAQELKEEAAKPKAESGPFKQKMFRGERANRADAPYSSDPGDFGRGVYHTSEIEQARVYGGGRAAEIEVQLDNPLRLTADEAYDLGEQKYGDLLHGSKEERLEKAEKMTRDLLSQGYDGLVVTHPDGHLEVVDYRPYQEKSEPPKPASAPAPVSAPNPVLSAAFDMAGTDQPAEALKILRNIKADMVRSQAEQSDISEIEKQMKAVTVEIKRARDAGKAELTPEQKSRGIRAQDVRDAGSAANPNDIYEVGRAAKGKRLREYFKKKKAMEGAKAKTGGQDWREVYESSPEKRQSILKAIANGKSTPQEQADALSRLRGILDSTGAYDIAYDISKNPASSPETKAEAQALYETRYPPTPQKDISKPDEGGKISPAMRQGDIPTVREINESYRPIGGSTPKPVEPPKPDYSSLTPIERIQKAKADKFLDTQVRYSNYDERPELNGIHTRREHIESLMDGGTLEVKQVRDDAAQRKLQREFDRLRNTAPTGNENHPETKRLREIQAVLKADGPVAPSYRINTKDGHTYIVSKTEYDYAKTLEGKSSPAKDISTPEPDISDKISPAMKQETVTELAPADMTLAQLRVAANKKARQTPQNPDTAPYQVQRVQQGSGQLYQVVNPYTGDKASEVVPSKWQAEAMANVMNHGGDPLFAELLKREMAETEPKSKSSPVPSGPTDVKAAPELPSKSTEDIAFEQAHEPGAITLSEFVTRAPEKESVFRRFFAARQEKNKPAFAVGDDVWTSEGKYQFQFHEGAPKIVRIHDLSKQGFDTIIERYFARAGDPHSESISYNKAADDYFKGIEEKRAAAAKRAEEQEAVRRQESEVEHARYLKQQEFAQHLRERLSATKFHNEKITVPLRDGSTTTVKGPAVGGLIVHRELGDPKYAKTFEVTHMTSGMAVMREFPSQEQAKIAAMRLAELGDWTRSATDLQKDADLTNKVTGLAQAIRKHGVDVIPETVDSMIQSIPEPAQPKSKSSKRARFIKPKSAPAPTPTPSSD